MFGFVIIVLYFAERELAVLRVEFLHHLDKIDELNALHAELNDLGRCTCCK